MKVALYISGVVCCILALFPSPVRGQGGFKEAEMSFLQENGLPVAQAGSHPYIVENVLSFATEDEPVLGVEVPIGSPKRVRFDLPPGFAGNPTAIPYCSDADFFEEECPVATELGVADVLAGSDLQKTHVGVYNLKPDPGTAAKIGFKALTVPVSIRFLLNPRPPYNLSAEVTNIPEVIPFYGATVRIWGVPTDSAHDSERVACGGSCILGLPQKPFVVMPRSCQTSLTTRFGVEFWESPGQEVTQDSTFPQLSGCGSLPFAPTISSQPTSQDASSPTGLRFNVDVTDEGLNDPNGIASSDIKRAVVSLPKGVTVNPAIANGLDACAESEFLAESVFTAPNEGCPQAAKVGSVEVETPLLEGTLLKGEVYVATPRSNPFGSLLALYMVIREPRLGIFVGLPGRVEADPVTGQLRTTFGEAPYEVPQFPFSHLRFRFREGPRAPLVTPPTCGIYETKAEFTPWARPASPYTSTAAFEITSCAANGNFDPSFEAGTSSNSASQFSPFNLRITRGGNDPELTRFNAVLPSGVAGRLAGIPSCSDTLLAAADAKTGLEEISSPSCPAAAEVGRVLVGAGAGSALTFVEGRLYLAGPFNGAPRSIAAVVPGVAGPFDIGTVVVRQALNANPLTSLVEVDGSNSEPFPRILEGIPLRVRDIRVFVNRPNFTFNASGCSADSATATIFGSSSASFSGPGTASASRNASYQAADCSILSFNPKVSLRFKGGMKRNGHPSVHALVSYPYPAGPGHSNLASVTAMLPKSEFIDQNHINNPCTRVQFNANSCPPASILGTAKAWTPVLDHPLVGPVYFRSNGGERELPDIVTDLHGEGFRAIQIGFVDSVNGRIRTRFLSVPDLPVEKISLSLYGGKKGLLVNSVNLCSKTRRASLKLSAHNGTTIKWNPSIGTDCPKQRHNGR